MNKDFPRIITFLRKERGLSQKQVAGDMGISQALLSHYEKGIRECGLDFLVKTADELKNDPDFEKWLAGDSSVKPPRGESNADFTRRVCKMFESIVEGLMKTGTTESVIVTHGGVIMTLLAVYGLPQAKPFEWTMDNGFGYSLRVTPVLWQRDKVCEVFQTIPLPSEND